MDLSSYLDSRRELINTNLQQFIHARYSDEMMRVAAYITMGGKRLRGTLTCLVCESLGGSADQAMVGAVAGELIHAASLSHDDIQDGDTTRRGMPSAWVSHGVMKAIMVPHVMVPHAALFISQYGLRAMWSVIEHWSQITQGQVHDMPEFQKVGALLPVVAGDYERIIGQKTGAGFEIAAELGARATRQDWLIRPAQAYGQAIGMAFQVADDACDLLENEGQGWVSLGKDGKMAVSLQALKLRLHGGDTITAGDVTQAWEMTSGWVAQAKERARVLPTQGEYGRLLEEFPQVAIDALRQETEAKIQARSPAKAPEVVTG